MYEFASRGRKKNHKNWLKYRLYSRQLMRQPMNVDLHTNRIMMAMELDEREPLQGALADMFFGCWYELSYFGEHMLAQVEDKLNAQILAEFEQCMTGKKYVTAITPLATRWSVLVGPSMCAYEHQLRISSDDSRMVAEGVITNLVELYEEEEDDEDRAEMIANIEAEFINHCKATDDRLAFSIVWWELAKKDWDFNDHWMDLRNFFEQKMAPSKRFRLTHAS